ncbi:MIT domain-containing protein 1 [Geodia barretti]|jgi:hypothetical protein|uniref:MIT domain-containing protein 1 n=1 Tax=Geodia barretti TaxID=519541 RepID=A0AA35TE19_GEOBA|nr:MIT domain-containing protein 1 [Geodia barretti]
MDAAKDLLKRAVELDSAQRYSEALICYEEGIQNLLRVMGGCSEEEKKELRKKAEEYLARAEVLKQEARDGDVATEKVRCVQVRPGDKGHSYSSVFGGCMDGNVESISVRDPYIRARHQLHNFVRFCELAVRNCRRLKAICLITGREPQTESLQASSLKELEESLKDYSVVLTVEYSDTLHDREIRFSNGWIVRMGRGLDYFQKSKGQFTIGCNDFDLRPCHETTIEIYHRLNMKSVNKT